MVLSPGGTLSGRVFDRETGAPLAGANVEFLSNEGWQSFGRDSGVSVMSPFAQRVLSRATTGADGAFRLERVPAPAGDTPSRAAASRDTVPPPHAADAR